MQHTFGCAAASYTRGIHPRLWCGPADVPRLRPAIRRGHGRKLMDALRRRVRPLIEAVETCDAVPLLIAHHTVRTHPRGGAVLYALPEMALVGTLDEDARTLDTVRRILAAVPEAEAKGPRDTYRLGYALVGELQLAYDFLHGRMTPDERSVFVRWAVQSGIRETVAYLRQAHYLRGAGANVNINGMLSALLTLLAVRGDAGAPDLAAEQAELLRYFEATLFGGMGPNGYPEEDIAYGSGQFTLLARVVEPLRRAGLYDVYAQCPRYTKFGQAMLHFVQPWGKFLSNTGDFGASFGWRSPVFPRLAAVTRDPTLLWLHGTLLYPIAASGPMDMKAHQADMPEVALARGFHVPADVYSLLTVDDLRRPAHPAKTRTPTQFMDPSRGIVTFRSSWRPDATFVVFDGSQRSPSAQGHAHDSGGHFSLSALGEYFAIDTGRYNIEQDQHNVVLVDGRSGQSTQGEWRASWYQAALTDYRPGAFVDTASVTNSQMADCYWSKRTLGLVKDPAGCGMPAWVWTVEDVNKANDYREFWWAMNVHPDHRIELAADHATVIGSDRGNCLDVFFVLPAPSEYPRPHTLTLAQDRQSYGSQKYMWDSPENLARLYREQVGHLEYGPVFLRPRLLGKVAGYNGRFMSVMIPRRKGAPLPRVETLPTLENALAVRITVGRVSDTLIWAYEHHLLEADDIQGRGAWCVVRRARHNGKVLAWELADGARLEVAGRPLTPMAITA